MVLSRVSGPEPLVIGYVYSDALETWGCRDFLDPVFRYWIGIQQPNGWIPKPIGCTNG